MIDVFFFNANDHILNKRLRQLLIVNFKLRHIISYKKKKNCTIRVGGHQSSGQVLVVNLGWNSEVFTKMTLLDEEPDRVQSVPTVDDKVPSRLGRVLLEADQL